MWPFRRKRQKKQSFAINSDNFMSWHKKGLALEVSKRYQEAIQCFDKVLEIAPEFIDAWIAKGRALNLSNQHEKACVCFDRALQLNPRSFKAWDYKGSALLELDQYEMAIPCFEQALQLDPGHWGAYLSKGVCEENIGNANEAIHSYRKFLELAPPSQANMVKKTHQRLKELENKEARMLRYIDAMKEALRVVQRTNSASDWPSTLYRLSELHALEEPEMAAIMRQAADASEGVVLDEEMFRQHRDRMETKVARNLEESISLLKKLRSK